MAELSQGATEALAAQPNVGAQPPLTSSEDFFNRIGRTAATTFSPLGETLAREGDRPDLQQYFQQQRAYLTGPNAEFPTNPELDSSIQSSVAEAIGSAGPRAALLAATGPLSGFAALTGETVGQNATLVPEQQAAWDSAASDLQAKGLPIDQLGPRPTLGSANAKGILANALFAAGGPALARAGMPIVAAAPYGFRTLTGIGTNALANTLGDVGIRVAENAYEGNPLMPYKTPQEAASAFTTNAIFGLHGGIGQAREVTAQVRQREFNTALTKFQDAMKKASTTEVVAPNKPPPENIEIKPATETETGVAVSPPKEAPALTPTTAQPIEQQLLPNSATAVAQTSTKEPEVVVTPKKEATESTEAETQPSTPAPVTTEDRIAAIDSEMRQMEQSVLGDTAELDAQSKKRYDALQRERIELATGRPAVDLTQPAPVGTPEVRPDISKAPPPFTSEEAVPEVAFSETPKAPAVTQADVTERITEKRTAPELSEDLTKLTDDQLAEAESLARQTNNEDATRLIEAENDRRATASALGETPPTEERPAGVPDQVAENAQRGAGVPGDEAVTGERGPEPIRKQVPGLTPEESAEYWRLVDKPKLSKAETDRLDEFSDKIPQAPNAFGDPKSAASLLVRTGKATVHGALDRIAQSDSPSADVAAHLRDRFGGLTAGSRIVFDPEGKDAFYNPPTHNVHLGEVHLSDRDIVHEAIHAITSSIVDKAVVDAHPNIQLGDLGGADYIKAVRKTQSDPNTPKPVRDLIGSYFHAVESLGKMPNLLKGDLANNAARFTGKEGVDYGLVSLHEFLSEAFSNPNFAQKLNSIKDPRGGTVWTRLLDSVRRMIGMKADDKSLLASVLKSGGEIGDLNEGTSVARGEGPIRQAKPNEEDKPYIDRGQPPVEKLPPDYREEGLTAYKDLPKGTSQSDIDKSPNSRRILFSKRNEEDLNPGFYSKLSETIDKKMPKVADVAQIKGIINAGGLKAEELKWSGIIPWLESKAQGDPNLPKSHQWLSGATTPEEVMRRSALRQADRIVRGLEIPSKGLVTRAQYWGAAKTLGFEMPKGADELFAIEDIYKKAGVPDVMKRLATYDKELKESHKPFSDKPAPKNPFADEVARFSKTGKITKQEVRDYLRNEGAVSGSRQPLFSKRGEEEPAVGQTAQRSPVAKSAFDRIGDFLKQNKYVARAIHRFSPSIMDARDNYTRIIDGQDAVSARAAGKARDTLIRALPKKEDQDAANIVLASGGGRIGEAPSEAERLNLDSMTKHRDDLLDQFERAKEPEEQKALKQQIDDLSEGIARFDADPQTVEGVTKKIQDQINKGKLALENPEIPEDRKAAIRKWMPVFERAAESVERLSPASKLAKREYDDAYLLRHPLDPTGRYYQDYAGRIYEYNESRGNAPAPPASLIGGSYGGTKFNKSRFYPTVMDAMIGHSVEGGGWEGESPKSLNLPDLVANHVKSSNDFVGGEAVKERFQTEQYPDTNEPVIASVEPGQKPPANYVKVTGPRGEDVWVYHPVADLFKSVWAPDAIKNTDIGKGLTKAAGVLKHGTVAYDVFHPSRLIQIGAFEAIADGKLSEVKNRLQNYGKEVVAPAILRGEQGQMGKFLALFNVDARDIDRYVRDGTITQETADYLRSEGATDLKQMKDGGLRPQLFTDNLWKDAEPFLRKLTDKIGLGTGKLIDAQTQLNKATFDRLAPAMMAQVFKWRRARLAETHPELTAVQLSRRAATETNERFGNLGKSGPIKSATAQSFANIISLAPMWQISQLAAEARQFGQLGRAAVEAAWGKTMPNGQRERVFRLGNSAKFLASTAATIFALNQAVNMATRGHPTWQNPEDDHKFDAWIPGGKNGFFYSPTTLVAEYSHHFKNYRQFESPIGAIAHIATNKLSPMGQAAKIALTQKNYKGEKLSTAGTIGEVAKSLTPIPISVGSAAQPLNPMASPSKSGQLGLNVARTFGVGLDRAPDAVAIGYQKFAPYRTKDRPETGPSVYRDLKTLVQNDASPADIKKEVERLKTKEGKKLEDIRKSFEFKNLAGSYANDLRAIKEKPELKKVLEAAKAQKKAEADAFRKALQSKWN